MSDSKRREVARRLRELEVCETFEELTGTLECAYAMLSEFIKSVTIEEVN